MDKNKAPEGLYTLNPDRVADRVGECLGRAVDVVGELHLHLDGRVQLVHLGLDASPFDRFGLREHMDAMASALPLGLRQRLSLAVAVIHEPEMLILDEPTSGVDPVARDQFWELLVELSRNDKVTIFISTHFMNEAERCDRVLALDAGRLVSDSGSNA